MTDDLRAALSGLRRADVPPAPVLGLPAPTPRRPAGSAFIAGAAALLVAAVVVVLSIPRPAPPAIGKQMDRIDQRIDRVELPELKALLKRELELMKMELALAPED